MLGLAQAGDGFDPAEDLFDTFAFALAHPIAGAPARLSNLASMLRMNLFTYRDLNAWLDNPFGTPPLLPDPQQLTLALA